MPDAENYQHYQVLRREDGSLWELGRGAMGITYKAFDTNLRCTVALKVINNTYLDSEVARQRFLREARAAAALRHQNVASVFHLGSDHDSYFYAMEYIDGETVDAFMAARGKMEPVEALRICLQVTRALAAAARQQLVHRDLKPANLMLVDEDGEKIVKVIDFGLAKTAKREGEDSGTLTIAGGFVGTPHFASPEQLEERDIDIRSDIYSLGATLYYMLTGRPPYSGSVAQIMSQHLYKPIPIEPLADIPSGVTALIEKMMQKDREKRPQTPGELRREIVGCLEQLQGASSTTVPIEAEAVAASLVPPPAEKATTAEETIPDEPLTRESVLGRRYQLIRELDEVPQGRQFLAYDLRQSRQVTLLIFSASFLADTVRFTSMEEEVNRLQIGNHTGLRQVYSLESTAHHSFLVQEWVVGPSLLEILRARSTMTAPEVIKLLDQLAPLADHATQKNLQTVDFTLNGVQLTYPGLIQAAISTQLLQKPLSAWPGLAVKVAALDFSSSGPSADQATWAGSATLIQGAGAGNGPRGSHLRLLSLLAYELLGGQRAVVETSGRISPVASLTEGGNVVLRRGITDDYPGSAAMLAEFREIVGGAERTVAPIEPLVREPLHDPEPELLPDSIISRSTTPETVHGTVDGIEVSTPTPAPVDLIAANQTSVPPPLPSVDSRSGETAVPDVPGPATPRPHVSKTGIFLVTALAVILIGILALGGLFVWRFAGQSGTNSQPTPFAQITPNPTSATLRTPSPKPTSTTLTTPSPKPTATAVATPTPKPTAAIVENTPTPVPTPSATPVETQQAALQRQLDSTAELIKNGDWFSGIKQYIQLSNQYSGSNVPREKLENLIAEVRSSKKIGSANVQEYRSDLEQAADLGSVQAMLLLGESTRQTDQEYALRWFEAAAAKGNDHAKVQAGLVLSNRRGDGDAARAFEYFKSAADNGNSEGKFTAGECYYLGKGTNVDVAKALELLQEAAAMREPRAMDLLGTHFRRAKDYQKAKAYFEEATQLGFVRSTVNLGVLYLQGEGVTQNYQTAATLFKKGAERSDSYGMFFYAECLSEGKGVQKDASAATEWAKKAAQAGNPLAIQWCKAKNINYQ